MRGLSAEWVCTCALCVRAHVCSWGWGGVSEPEPVGCAGDLRGGGRRGAARLFVQPEDLGRDRER